MRILLAIVLLALTGCTEDPQTPTPPPTPPPSPPRSHPEATGNAHVWCYLHGGPCQEALCNTKTGICNVVIQSGPWILDCRDKDCTHADIQESGEMDDEPPF